MSRTRRSRPPHSRANIKDVALAAKVSTATVSRVVSDNGYPVAETTRQRVLAAVERLGYQPNDLARSLLSERTNTIGVIVPDLANPHYPEIVRGIEEVAAEHSHSVLFCNTDRRPEKLQYHLDVLSMKRADGLILAGGGFDPTPTLGALADLRTKVLVIGRYRHHDYPSIETDNLAAGRLAARHVLELGHERVAVITGPRASTASMDRLRGCRQALRERGLSATVIEGDFRAEGGYSSATELLRANNRPTAIIAGNDGMAFGALAAAHDLGLRVPGDVAIVGYDDVAMARYIRPALSTIRLPTHEIGATAMTNLLALLRGERVSRRTVMAVELVIRQSTAGGTSTTDS